MENERGFNRTNNRGTKVCPRCGKQTWKSRGFGRHCKQCTDELEQMNAHYDRVHEESPNPEGCPLCRAEGTATRWYTGYDGQEYPDTK